MNQFTWHDRPAKDVVNALHSRSAGLTTVEIEERLEEYGQNVLPKKAGKSAWSILVAQFASPFMIILLFAAIVSFVLKEWVDVTVISMAILVNSLLGFFEEYKADRSLQALKSYLPEEVQVRRGGEALRINARDLVVGDILLLAAGDKVTADARLIEAHALEVGEAALTGESQSIVKQVKEVTAEASIGDRLSMVFAGTQVTAGRAEAVVTAIGIHTELGKISKLVDDVQDEKTPLQKQLHRFAKKLGFFLVGLAIFVFVVGLLRGFAFVEMFYLSVALAVAAVPEGLVVAVTVVLAIGMQRILKKKALVRKLVATETLGSVGVICMDKTGTLTTGEMHVEQLRGLDGVIDPNSKAAAEIIECIARLNAVLVEKDAKTGKELLRGNPTSIALHQFLGELKNMPNNDAKLLGEIPFTSERKYAARMYSAATGQVLYALGAPDILLERLAGTDAVRQRILVVLNQMIAEGHRVILAGSRNESVNAGNLNDKDVCDLAFLGLIGLKDPLRKDSAQTIALARSAGLRPIMITGDHPETAQLIAQEAGIDASPGAILTGADLNAMSNEQLSQKIATTAVFARVVPLHKLRIVQAWQSRGKSVAMTGDGVNDAPALKASDVGIALGSGTEVAKETSDMVLLDNRFATIVDAIREGRIIFDNLRKMIVYLLTGTFSEIVLVAGALLLGLPLPLLPAQILWINLITDGLPGVALAFEEGEKGIMQEPPRKKGAPVINREMRAIIISAAGVTNLVLFSLYLYLLSQNMPIAEIRTFIFMGLGLSSLVYVFAVRRLRSSAFSKGALKNRVLLFAIGAGLILQFIPVLSPTIRDLFDLAMLAPFEWLVLGGVAVVNFLLIEFVKWVFNRRRRA